MWHESSAPQLEQNKWHEDWESNVEDGLVAVRTYQV
jgi:hypothetical protein